MFDDVLSRRRLLKGACASAAGIALAGFETTLAAMPRDAGASDPKGMLKGFVVADAHFGWNMPGVQPPVEVMREMMGRILSRFPDLDIFIDAGDALHGNKERDRGEWTDVIANGCGQVPFLYVAGNHEIMSFRDGADPEDGCSRMGSVPCRPYYSFDLKGMHFLSLPELMSFCIVTREALEWAALDLEANRDRTTVILSHNAIANTTLPHFDSGYRSLANSEEVFNLINRCPNVLAWMHGHNHTWEIVPKSGKLYVSCGRIGGFDPPPLGGAFGQGHLGGMYFEVAPDRFSVRGYSATENKFFDELESYEHLTQTIKGKTTYDPSALACISYGVGGAPDGQKVRAANHYAGASVRREVFLAGCSGSILNENADFQHCAIRPVSGKDLPAIGLQPSKNKNEIVKPAWDWLDPGIRLNPLDNPESERVLKSPEGAAGSVSYYRCAPGRRYSAAIEVKAKAGGQSLKLECQVHDNEGNLLKNLAVGEWRLEPGGHRYEAAFEVPAINETTTIYSDPTSDRTIQLTISATFGPSAERIYVRRFSLALAGASEETKGAAIVVDGAEFGRGGILGESQHAVLPVPGLPGSHTLFEARAGGSGRVTWLVRHEGVRWQVRNATVQDTERGMAVGPLRNTFCPKNEIVLAPLIKPTGPYVSRTRNIDRFSVRFPSAENQSLTIAVEEILGPAEIEVFSEFKPSEVSGGAKWEYSQRRALIRVEEPGVIVVG